MSNRVIIWYVFLLCLFPMTLWSHDDLDIQIERLTSCIQTDPSNPSLYMRRGKLFLKQEKWTNSIRDFEQSIRKGGKESNARYNLAFAWYKLGQYEYAHQQTELILATQVEHSQAWWIKGKILEMQSKHHEAIKCFQKSLEFNYKSQPDDYLHFVDVLGSLGPHNYLTLALQVLDDGIDHLGPLVVLLQKKVNVCHLLNKLNQAIQIQSQVIQIMNRKEKAYFQRAQLNFLNKDYAKARNDAIQAKQLIYALPPKFRNLIPTKELLININHFLNQLSVHE